MYTENGHGAIVSRSINVTDVDVYSDARLESATVEIMGGMRSGDALFWNASASSVGSSVSSSYNASSGVLVLTGSVTQSEWQTVLREVMFSSSSEDPTGTQQASTRRVAFAISDGDLDSNTVVRSVSVMPVNDAPALSGVETSALAYVENDGSKVVSASLLVSDVDFITDDHLESATVRISQGKRAGDVLEYTSTGMGISGQYNESTGALTLVGSAAVSDWQSALRAVTFSSSSEDPTGTQQSSSRTVAFVISDGNASSNVVERSVSVMPVNDAPVLADVEPSSAAWPAPAPARAHVGTAAAAAAVAAAAATTKATATVLRRRGRGRHPAPALAPAAAATSPSAL